MSKKTKHSDIFEEVRGKEIHEESYISWGVNKLLLKKLYGKWAIKLWGSNKFKN